MASVLVIDDEEGYRSAMRRALESDGHEVRVAPEGMAGITLLREQAADVVICDLFMPGVEGLTAIRLIRREFPDVAIIAVSGAVPLMTADMLRAAATFGARKTLRKPFDELALLDAVREVLGGF